VANERAVNLVQPFPKQDYQAFRLVTLRLVNQAETFHTRAERLPISIHDLVALFHVP